VAVFPIAQHIDRNDLPGGFRGVVEGGVVGEAKIAAEPVENSAGHKGQGRTAGFGQHPTKGEVKSGGIEHEVPDESFIAGPLLEVTDLTPPTFFPIFHHVFACACFR
jgi:hypothetical protein